MYIKIYIWYIYIKKRWMGGLCSNGQDRVSRPSREGGGGAAETGDLRVQRSQLQVAKVTGSAASKLSKIRVVCKSLAHVLTVINQTQRNPQESLQGQEARAPDAEAWEDSRQPPPAPRARGEPEDQKAAALGAAVPTAAKEKKIKTQTHTLERSWTDTGERQPSRSQGGSLRRKKLVHHMIVAFQPPEPRETHLCCSWHPSVRLCYKSPATQIWTYIRYLGNGRLYVGKYGGHLQWQRKSFLQVQDISNFLCYIERLGVHVAAKFVSYFFFVSTLPGSEPIALLIVRFIKRWQKIRGPSTSPWQRAGPFEKVHEPLILPGFVWLVSSSCLLQDGRQLWGFEGAKQDA